MAQKAVRKAQQSPPPSKPMNGRQIAVTDNFRLIFLTTTLITAACGIGSIALAFRGADTPATKDVLNVMLTVFQIGFGAIVGLLSGKSM
jgi:hypothetical protein